MGSNQSISIQSIPKLGRVGVLHVKATRRLHDHEIITLTKLLRFGEDIICQAESKLTKTADIIWRGEEWEIKSVIGKSRNTIKNSVRKARKQSHHIIIDLTNSSFTIERSLGKIKALMSYNKEILKLFILSKENYCVLDKTMLR